jgi:ComF family protein
MGPKVCSVCGNRLGSDEEVMCACCYRHLPITNYADNAEDNEMTRMIWGKMPIERGVAMFFYHPHSPESNMIYNLKYRHHPEIGRFMGRMMAKECMDKGVFDGIDAIVPIPLERGRERTRGYNQSFEIAMGVSFITGIAVVNDAVSRTKYNGSQTRKNRMERAENVEGAFKLKKGDRLQGKHILLIDDIVTTGATMLSCGKEIMKAGDVKISILALGFTK